jgi:hypothetical protein
MARNSLFASSLIASGAGALWAALVLTITFVINPGIWQSPDVALALFGTARAYAGIVCFAMTWTIGLAWHAAAQRLKWRSFAAYVAAGTAAGLSISLLVVSLMPSPAATDAFIIVYLSSCAAVVSAVGWLVRRPDRDPPNPDTRTP